MSTTSISTSEQAKEQIRYLVLNEGDQRTKEIFRLRKGSSLFPHRLLNISLSVGWIFELRLSSRLSCRKVRLLSNVPLSGSSGFVRSHYEEVPWICPQSHRSDGWDRYVVLPTSRSGSFHYYFTIDGTTFVSLLLLLRRDEE